MFEKLYPLTLPQRRIFYTELVYPGTDFASLTFLYPTRRGADDVRAALLSILARHEELLLRVRGAEADDGLAALRQYVGGLPDEPIAVVECGDCELAARELASRPFPLWDSPLFEFYYLKSDSENTIFLRFHHSIIDGAGVNLFADELFKELGGETPIRKAPAISELLAMEEKYLASDECAADRSWWLENLHGLPDPAELRRPADGEPAVCGTSDFILPDELHRLAVRFCERHGKNGRPLTPYRLGLAVSALFISRWFRMDDVVVTAAGNLRRYSKALRDSAAMLVSTLPVRINADKNLAFSVFVERVDRALDDALAHGRYPFDKLVSDLRAAGGQEIPSAFAVVHNGKSGDDYGCRHIPFTSDTLPLTLRINTVMDDSLGLRAIRFDYQKEQFTGEEIENMKECLAALLESVLSNPEAKIGSAGMLPENQKKKILKEFNDTYRPYDPDETVVRRFAKIASRCADEKALVYKNRSYTYAQLDSMSGAVARRLKKLGAGADSVVAIMLPRIPEFVICIWGALKAGAAYLPIDPEAPEDRTRYMLADASPLALITSAELAGLAAGCGCEVIDALDPALYADGGGADKPSFPKPEDLAYIIYTSGTTGKPKGVMVTHLCLANFCAWVNEYYSMKTGEGTLSCSNFIFDASVFELFPPFFNGGFLAVLPTELKLQMDRVHDYIEQHNVSHMIMTTQLAEQFSACRDNSSLKTLAFGGEVMRPVALRSWKSYNAYGPTECTVMATSFPLDEESAKTSAPIGVPLANLKAYIVDGEGALCPIGVPGELCFAGRQVARGYLNKPEVTAKAFVENRWSEGEFDKVMYRTGDLCRWGADGNIVYMGRIDQQVKIRGYRIELGEIEQRLMELPEVENAVVMAKNDPFGGKYLCAWVVGAEKLAPEALTEKLSKVLPRYMIPAVFVQIEAVPYNTSGKVDRRALPEPEFKTPRAEYAKPVTEAQKKMACLWRELLGVEKPGQADDFMELGGNSLTAIRLQGRVLKETGRQLQVRDILARTKLAEMAALLENSTAGQAFKPIPKAPAADTYPVTPAQRQMYIMQKLDEGSTLYNVTLAVEIRGPLDTERCSFAIDEIVKREPSLRTVFEDVDGSVRQRTLDCVQYKKSFCEVSSLDGAKAKLAEMNRPFDLARAPLFRFGLVRIDKEHHVLLYVFHHAIIDGISLNRIHSLFWEIYDGESPSAAAIDYKDYACWRAEQEKTEEYAAKERWWMSQFDGGVPSLDMTTDFPRPSKPSDAGATVKMAVPPAAARKLAAITAAARATEFPALLALWAAVLGRCARTDDLVIGVPFSGREHPDTAEMTGMFVSTLPLRIKLGAEKSFRELVAELSALVEEARKRQDYPFESLVEKLGIERVSSRNPVFDVVFNLSPLEAPKSRGGMERRVVETEESDQAHFDMTMRLIREEKTWAVHLNYRKELFTDETARTVAESFVALLCAACDNPDAKLSSLSLLSKERAAEVLSMSAGKRLDIPADKVYHEIFSQQAALTPDNIAVGDLRSAYTYRELDRKTDALAMSLRKMGVGRESVAAILLPRRAEITVAVLGIMKAGGAYLPIDLGYPAQRVKYMLEDSGAKIAVGCGKTRAMLPEDFAGQFIDIDDKRLYENGEVFHSVSKPEDLAYVIYTSGSTGKPKGVMIEQRALVSHTLWAAQTMGLTADDAAAVHASFSFDSSVKQMMAPLTAGAATWIISEEMRLDIGALNAYFKEKHITAAYFPTKFAELFFESQENDELKFIMYGGEKATAWKKTPYKLINCYGPTEFTVNAATYEITQAAANIPIGRPVANSRGYITDQYGGLQPCGLPGELCMAGVQIARGYLNRPELTEKVFVEDPWDGGKMYRTGDLCRYLPNGDIEYLGRIDKQVKIRGFRIELGEIEDAIVKSGAAASCAVVSLKDPSGADCLAAYVVSERPIDFALIESKLRKTLPDYMIPSYWRQTSCLPLGASGKLDVKALPEPWGPAGAPDRKRQLPRTEKEAVIAELWKEVLGVKEVSVTDNFFALGGTSLKAIRLAGLMQRRYELSIATIFENQTIEKLAAAVSENAGAASAKLDRIRRKLRAPRPELDAAEIAKKEEYLRGAAAEDLHKYDEKTAYGLVLLTGATGYLGSYVMRELTKESAGVAVTAIVRAKDDEAARERLAERLRHYFGEGADAILERAAVFAGDLEKEKFGLDGRLYARLADSVEAVVNTAANVRHYGLYEEFYKTNVETVKNIIKFAEEGRKKEIEHISTLSVSAGAYRDKQAAVFTEDDCDRGQDSGNVYVRTKLEAEKELLAAARRGVRAFVVRVGNIAFSSANGSHQANLDENGFYTRMKSFINMGMVPERGLDFELSYVDKLAQGIVTLLGRRALAGKILHLVNGERHEMSAALLSRELGVAVEAMPMEKFFEKASYLYGKKGFASFVEALFTHLGWFDPADRDMSRVELLHSRTDRIMKHLGFEWGALDMKLLRPLVSRALEERRAEIARSGVFAAVGGETLDALARMSGLKSFAPDELIEVETKSAENLYLILDGCVEESRNSAYGWACTISLQTKGSLLGYEGLFEPGVCAVTAQAILDDVLTLEFPRGRLKDALRGDSGAAAAIAAELLKKWRVATFLLVNAG